jgi:hypothetical protein
MWIGARPRRSGRAKVEVLSPPKVNPQTEGASIHQGRLGGDVASSYFIECMLYNVPDSYFSGSCEDAFVAAWNWLESACNPAALMCQNGEMLPFGPSPGQWSTASAQTFLVALKQLWENW